MKKKTLKRIVYNKYNYLIQMIKKPKVAKIEFNIRTSLISKFFITISVIGIITSGVPLIRQEILSQTIKFRRIEYKIETSLTLPLETSQEKVGQRGFIDIIAGPKEQILIPADTNFSILIPKLGINSKVFSNVDPSDEKIFRPILQKGVAHAKGSVFPGYKGSVYLFAHSTANFWEIENNNAIFYSVKDLVVGDDIVIFFNNKRHNYEVFASKVIEANDVSYLRDSQKNDYETIILQACWPPGTTWKRLFVFAKPKTQINSKQTNINLVN